MWLQEIRRSTFTTHPSRIDLPTSLSTCSWPSLVQLKPLDSRDDIPRLPILVVATKNSPNRSADELLPRQGPRERRASGIGEHVGIPASNEHLSKGAGDVSGEAPPMLKSAVYENKTRIYTVRKSIRCVEELREFASAELGLCAELKSYASLPVRNWAYVPSWSGFCVEELREFASAELGLCAELVGLMRRRATRVCQCGTGLMCRAGRAYA
ncbi:myosin-6-like [Dorcoceras hygrometricum]|uniref:Myosin-6-like n=1 Tax=Dorcoceras hygrometricum TaxID=472368 RepID=A0A2Z7DCV4_9LAMI|nr:myosin-6-like [Dorcoceras hygrometricum]